MNSRILAGALFAFVVILGIIFGRPGGDPEVRSGTDSPDGAWAPAKPSPTPAPPAVLTPAEQLAIEDKSQHASKDYQALLEKAARAYGQTEQEAARAVITSSRSGGGTCLDLLKGIEALNK